MKAERHVRILKRRSNLVYHKICSLFIVWIIITAIVIKEEQPMKDFIILGGDLRFIYAAAKLNQNHDCAVYGFDMLHDDIRSELTEAGIPILRKIERARNVILPLPMSRNCDYITAPYHSGRIPIAATLTACAEGATIYCGRACSELRELCDAKGIALVDYFEQEELTVVNAAITAEGALEIIMREKPMSIMGMEVLVTGYGRIAKVLAKHLHALGAGVTIVARKHGDLALAKIAGHDAINFTELDDTLSKYDTVVNTVPAQILDKDRLARLKSEVLIVDLASKSGIEGMELNKVNSVSVAGVKVIWALSLPGKIAPITAGEVYTRGNDCFQMVRCPLICGGNPALVR
jgi:dipicolinate synthase subunit A